MAFLPAVCDECYSLFSSKIYVRDNQKELAGFKADPCPTCGSDGRVRGGLHKFIDYTLCILKAQDRTMIELTSLYDILLLAKADKLRQEHLEIIIIYDLPTFADILLLLPEEKEDYRLCLSLLIQIIYALIEISIHVNEGTERYKPIIKLHQSVKVNEILEQIYTNNTGTAKRLF